MKQPIVAVEHQVVAARAQPRLFAVHSRQPVLTAGHDRCRTPVEAASIPGGGSAKCGIVDFWCRQCGAAIPELPWRVVASSIFIVGLTRPAVPESNRAVVDDIDSVGLVAAWVDRP